MVAGISDGGEYKSTERDAMNIKCKKCGKTKRPGDIFFEDIGLELKKQGGEGYGRFLIYKQIHAGELCLACWLKNESETAKDIRECMEMEVLKTRIDVVSELLENKQKQEGAMRASDMLRAKYRDRVTGFKGVCTGFCEYISGCSQALLVPRVGKDGKSPDGGWYDVQRLECIGKKIAELDNTETPGCDMAAPIR